MQADGRLKMQGLQPRYKSMLDACVTIPRAEGWRAFYIGALPTVVRTICMSVSGIACYDQSREIIKEYAHPPPLTPRFVGRDDTDSFFYRALYSSFASLISGTLSTLVSNPFDVVKTRMMSQRQACPLSPLRSLGRGTLPELLGLLHQGMFPPLPPSVDPPLRRPLRSAEGLLGGGPALRYAPLAPPHGVVPWQFVFYNTSELMARYLLNDTLTR